MPIISTQHLKSYIGSLNSLNVTRRKMDFLISRNEIVRKDIERVYEGLFLNVFTRFEGFIEELFIGMLTGSIVHVSPKVTPKVSFSSKLIAGSIILGERSYVDWLPYNYTIKRAKAFFKDGLPFTVLDNRDKRTLEGMLTVRNAIAHKSKHSLKKFSSDIVGDAPLTGFETKPAGYLRSIFRSNPDQTRYEDYVLEIISLSAKICS